MHSNMKQRDKDNGNRELSTVNYLMRSIKIGVSRREHSRFAITYVVTIVIIVKDLNQPRVLFVKSIYPFTDLA